jgi:hypothetical protein
VNADHAVVDLPAVAVPLATNSRGRFAALGRARFVHATDGFAVGMLLGNDLLAAISEFLFIPLDRFEKALQRPRRGSARPAGLNCKAIASAVLRCRFDSWPLT